MIQLGKGEVMLMDEEGKLKNKPINETATRLYNKSYDVVVGDVVICKETDLN